MNKSLIRIFTALLFCSFSTIFLYAENNSEIATNDWKDGDEVTVSIEIGGQPGEYIFYSPQQQIIEFDGGANQIYRMKGTYYSGMGGVLVRFTVKATTSTSSRFFCVLTKLSDCIKTWRQSDTIYRICDSTYAPKCSDGIVGMRIVL
ncbi:MAG: hypothetical protein LUF01_11450 [Bacteroides sp.]|nr:hypothetical protein [Bacteroides sp.]